MGWREIEIEPKCSVCGQRRTTSEYTCDQCGKTVQGDRAFRHFIDLEWYEPLGAEDKDAHDFLDANLCSWECVAAYAERKVREPHMEEYARVSAELGLS